MALLSPDKVRALNPHTGEPFYWRGWFDGISCNGRFIILRNSMGPQVDFEGRVRAQIVGRVSPPFKTVPRYFDLYLFEKEGGSWVAQRRWISEAHGEEPCIYEVIEADDLEQMADALYNYDAAKWATQLWPDDMPGGRRRSDRMREWLQVSYAERVRLLIKAGRECCQ